MLVVAAIAWSAITPGFTITINVEVKMEAHAVVEVQGETGASVGPWW